MVEISVRIPGYLDGHEPPVPVDTLVNRTELVDSMVFWAMYLGGIGGSASAEMAFDVPEAEVQAMTSMFLDERCWPVLSLPVHGGTVHVVECNFPQEGSTDYLLAPADGRDAIRFAELSGHFRGPGMSWREIVATASQSDPTTADGSTWCAAMHPYRTSDHPDLTLFTAAFS